MEYISGSQELLYRLNKRRVLNILKDKGAVSRIDLARLSGLNAKTITNIAGDFLSQRLITSNGFESSRGGRRPELLSINKNYGVAFGIDLGATHLSGISVDMGGNILARFSVEIGFDDTKRKIFKKAFNVISRLVSENGDRKVLGIGFVLPGLVDKERGISIYATNLKGWRDVPLRKLLKEKFHLPVEVEDSSRAMALGEMWFGYGRGLSDYVFLDLGAGIGCGIINGGRLYRGFSSIAGEIGHTVVEVEGRKCRCGNSGCLETVASGMAIPQLIIEKLKQGKKSIIPEIINNDFKKITVKEIVNAARKGDKLAIDVLLKSGKYLGVAMANLINILNPKSIIVGGGLAKSGNLLLKPMEESMKRHAVPHSLKGVKIISSELGDDAAAMGGVALVMEKIFEL